jgi:hypothetical protein
MSLTKQEKKEFGAYFTPNSIVDTCFTLVNNVIDITCIDVLEPSCGDARFLKKHIFKSVDAIELNEKLFTQLPSIPNTVFLNQDFMKFTTDKRYHLVIGNPPYKVVSKKSIGKEYMKFIDCRPNLFALFLVKSLSLLKDDGILCFVLPCNFLSSCYYLKTREYIHKHFQIIDIVLNPQNFGDTKQKTCIFIVQNQKPYTFDHSIQYDSDILFGTKESILPYKNNYIPFHSLDYRFHVGQTLKHKVKDTGTTLFLETIKNQKYVNRKTCKVNSPGIYIMIYRGHGNGVEWDPVIQEMNTEFLLENHILFLKCDNLTQAQYVLSLLTTRRVMSFIQNILFGTGGISISDIQQLPIEDLNNLLN